MAGMMSPSGMAMQQDGTMEEVPPGSLPHEVADDIDAKLSEGEYVMPADVVRWHGLKALMAMRDEAKSGLAAMEADGQIGGAPVGPEEPDAALEAPEGPLGPSTGLMGMPMPEGDRGFAAGGLMAPKAPEVEYYGMGNWGGQGSGGVGDDSTNDATHGAGTHTYDDNMSFMDNMGAFGAKVGKGLGIAASLSVSPVAGMMGLANAAFTGKSPISPGMEDDPMARGMMSNVRDMVDSVRSESSGWGGRSSMPNSVDDWGALSAQELKDSWQNSQEDNGYGGAVGSGYGSGDTGFGDGTAGTDAHGGDASTSAGSSTGTDASNSYATGGLVGRRKIMGC
jgi:hypothetical protein